MWHTPLSNSESSTPLEDMAVEEEERSIPTIAHAIAGDSPNNALLPSSTAGVRYKIKLPYIATPLLPQICSCENILEMSANFQPSRNRNRNSVHFRHLLPHRRLYHNTYCNYRNTEEANFNLREEPSFRNDFSNSRMSPIPEDDHLLALSENELPPSERDFEVSNSIRGFSAPIDFAPEPSNITEDENNEPNLFESPNEFYMNHVAESLLGSVFKSNHAREQTPKSPKRILDPFQDGNDSLSPFLRIIKGLPSPTLSAQKLANKLIKLSRHLTLPSLDDLQCLNCNRIPRLPVTGKCGHSRCLSCIKLHGDCPCGAMSPKKLTVNTVMREITEKMTRYKKKPRIPNPGSFTRLSISKRSLLSSGPRGVRYMISRNSARATNAPRCSTSPRVPMDVQERHGKARELVTAGEFIEAVPHLARVAASTQPLAHMARKQLAQTITVLYQSTEPRNISRQLLHSVRNQSTHSWIRPSDVECVICTSTLKHPVTTPCGHSYCRGCLERSMCYTMKCALCLSPLRDFHIEDTRDTLFMKSLLSSIEEVNGLEDVNVIPIVTCYVAFPGMPCPLFIFDPKYWQMVRRVTESGSRKFGMLAYEEGNTYADYGTVLEICDCVVFEDNRCIISTIGVSRFKIIERFEKDGCDLARVGILRDVFPSQDDIPEMHLLDSRILFRALKWLKRMDESVQEEIETAFGPLPYVDTQESWWETADGPQWLWWLIAILPLKPEIKILMISTCSLLKRMLAVSRTFDVMNVESGTTESFQTISEAHEPTNSRWSLEDI